MKLQFLAEKESDRVAKPIYVVYFERLPSKFFFVLNIS